MADVKDLLIRMSLDSSTFKRNIQDAKGELRTLKAEYKAVASSDDIGKAGEKLLSNLKEQKTAAEALAEQYGKGIEALRQELEKATPGSQKAQQLTGQIQKLEKGLADARAQVNGLQQDIDGVTLDNFITKAESVASTFMSLRLGFGDLLDGFGDAADSADKAFVSRESAWTGVKKILNDREEYTEELGKELENWTREAITRIPVTYEELAAIEENALQAGGIAVTGLKDFAEAYAALQSATNIQGEAGVQTFGKYLTVMDTAEDEYHRLASVVVAMGNNFAALEDQIVATANRSASAMRGAGISAQDGLALATSALSMGMEEAAAATSLEKVIGRMAKASEVGAGPYKELLDLFNTWQADPQNIEKQMATMAKLNELKLDLSAIDTLEKSAVALEKFSRAVGMTGEEFAAAYNEDPAAMVIKFFDQLGQMNELESEGLLTYLDTLGITEIRAARLARNFALNADTVGNAVEIARQAYDEDKALEEEAQLRYATTESKRIMNANKAENANEALGKTVTAMRQPFDDFFADMRQGFAEMPELVQAFAAGTAEALGTLGDALKTAGDLSYSVVSIARAVKDLETTAVGRSLLRKMQLIGTGVSTAAGAVLPPALLAGGTVALGAALDKASTEANWGEYNRTQAELPRLMQETADAETAKMQGILEGFSQAMAATESIEPGEDRMGPVKDAFRRYANDLLRDMPDLKFWDTASFYADLSDGLDAAEIEKIISGMEFADQWYALGNEAVTSLGRAIEERQAELESAATDMGAAIPAGLAEGIYANIDQAVAAAEAMSSAVESVTRETLDIHSPSGVARSLGAYFAEGFAQGIENGVTRVEQSMDRLARAVTPALDGSGNPVSRNVNVTLALDGRTLAQSLAPLMDTALGDLNWDM